MIRRLAGAWGERMSIDQRLAELGITLPQPAAPVAAYVPTVEHGGLIHISGQISFAEDGSLIKGRLGEDLDLDAGVAAARRCGIMLVAQLKAALGSLDRVEKIVKLGVFVNSTPAFVDQPRAASRPVRNARSGSLPTSASASRYAVRASSTRPSRRRKSALVAGR